MNNIGDTRNVQNLQTLVNNYENIIKELSSDLDEAKLEEQSIRQLLLVNSELSVQLETALSEQQFKVHNLEAGASIDDLKIQLDTVHKEKEHAIELWKNSAKTVEALEEELRIYQTNSEDLIPKSKLVTLKTSYDQKLNELHTVLSNTKRKFEDTITLTARELKLRDQEKVVDQQSHEFKIVKNLEEEILNLQKRLGEARRYTLKLETIQEAKSKELEAYRNKVKECKSKVEESVGVVEAALNEKDAALLREVQAKEEVSRLSKTITDIIDATDDKLKTEIKMIETNYSMELEKLRSAIKQNEERERLKSEALEKYTRKCVILEAEMERVKSGQFYNEESSTSKLLILEKNLENTFQKLLLSEKQNVQLRAEKDSIKSDMDQMAEHYQRDIKARDSEKNAMKEEIKKTKWELDMRQSELIRSSASVAQLSENIRDLEQSLKHEMEKAEGALSEKCLELNDIKENDKRVIEELQEQLSAQVAINKRWRVETKNITEKLETRINEFKAELNRLKCENKSLTEKLRDSNTKTNEYKQFLELISQDVTKITNSTDTKGSSVK